MVQAMIIQNAVSPGEGLSSLWAVRRAFWQVSTAHEAEVRTNLLSMEATKRRHIGTSPDVSLYNPDLWTDEDYLFKPTDGRLFSWICFMTTKTISSPIRSGSNGCATPSLRSSSFGGHDPRTEVHILDAGRFSLHFEAARNRRTYPVIYAEPPTR